MAKVTDLDYVRTVARAFLHYDLLPDEKSPMLLHHPFFNCPMTVYKNEMVDLRDSAVRKNIFEEITKKIQSARSAANITDMLQPKWRMEFFKYIERHLNEEDYACLLRDAWTGSEFPNRDPGITLAGKIRFFRKVNRSLLMNKREQKVFDSFPDIVTVYRGCCGKNAVKGISWTLSFEKAKWFAERFPMWKGTVYTATIPKQYIYAYFNDRDEQEIVLDSRMLQPTEHKT